MLVLNQHDDSASNTYTFIFQFRLLHLYPCTFQGDTLAFFLKRCESPACTLSCTQGLLHVT